MVKIEKSIFINLPKQDVFDFVSDTSNDAKWQSTIRSSGWLSPGPAGVGSTMRSTGKFMGRKFENTSQVTIWNPPSELAFKSVDGHLPFEFSVKLETERGGTRMSFRGSVEIAGFFKLAERLVVKQFNKQFDADIQELKRVLEAG